MSAARKLVSGTASGYDDAVSEPEQDRLDRWPFAKEVYGVATTGPREWSVRIGVYGEWGTGKTSVLKFVERMARAQDHLVVWFNPWQFSSKRDLWHAFVQAVGAADPSLDPRRHISRFKRWGAPVAKWLSEHSDKIAAAADDKRVSFPLVGIQLLRHYVFSTQKDLQKILGTGGTKRLIVLIDDIDRANSEIVPEMLYAIKEIFNVPGIAFVCAFDPIVIGAVLKEHHPGFGDGLKFLEKIIDYPRWLPAPTEESVLKLVQHDINSYCDYVPLSEMQQVVHLLPRNPRAVRQFTRLLSLLRPQIERHHTHELMWPVILAANVIKIRYPRLAPLLLADKDFWEDIAAADMFRDGEEEKKDALLDKHVASVLSLSGVPCTDEERKAILASLSQLAERTSIWAVGAESLVHQMHIAEAPAAVTWKEFDAFLGQWQSCPGLRTAQGWIQQHAESVARTYSDVYSELLDAAIDARQSALSQAADKVAECDMKPCIERSDLLMSVLECLTFDLARLDQEEKRLRQEHVERIFKSMTYYLGWTHTDEYKRLRKAETDFVRRLVDVWSGDVTILMSVLKPFSDDFVLCMQGEILQALYRELQSVVVSRFACSLIDRFRSSGFIASVYGRAEGAYDIKCVLLDPNGALWKEHRVKILHLLRTAKEDPAIHQNAYEMVHWFGHNFRKERGFGDTPSMEALLSDCEIREAIWNAAIAHPLNPRAIGAIREFPGTMTTMNMSVELPQWWKPAHASLGITQDEASEETELQQGTTLEPQ